MFQWSRMDAQQYLLLQRRNRIYGTADCDHGQCQLSFSGQMLDTLKSLAGNGRFAFSDVFDETLPEEPATGNALANVQQALEKAALQNMSSNIFVDTSTSLNWSCELAEGVSTCVRPTHPIYSVQLKRFLTPGELLRCQGIFKQDFENPMAIDKVLETPKLAQDLAGNAFASTCAQAQLIASLCHASGWAHVTGVSSTDGPQSQDEVAPQPSALKRKIDHVEQPDVSRSPSLKRKHGIDAFLKKSDPSKRLKFAQPPAGLPHQDLLRHLSVYCTVLCAVLTFGKLQCS